MVGLLCCVREAENVKVLDYRHSGLSKIPGAVASSERTLEELYLDSNQIKSLPRELFCCDSLKKLTLSDNEVKLLPTAIGGLSRLEELDVSKNGILELPEDIKGCKNLRMFEASVNPLGRLPDGFTQLLNLTCVHLNDAFLEYLPGSFGRLAKLKILELRENHLKTLPKSLGRLTELERLDIGNNEFAELPDVIGCLTSLLEFWCDSNQIVKLPDAIGSLKQLMYLDASKNRISSVGERIDGCMSLSDLHLSMNLLQQLPQTIGRLSNLTTLKVNDNRLTSLPVSLGGLVALSELDVTANDLEELPPTIGLLRHLRTLIADENFLVDIPPELGSCSALTVLSARSNKLTYLPDEIGRVQRLRVLNVSDNELKCLPCSLVSLRELQALWLAENQAKPLIRLQPETDSLTGKRSLTCYLLPQQRTDAKTYADDDNTSFRASVWDEQRVLRQQIRFDTFSDVVEKMPTNYPKERVTTGRHEQNMAVLKKASSSTAAGMDVHSRADVSGGAADEMPRATPHRLLRLEKERLAKDRARINSRRSSGGGSDVEEAVPMTQATDPNRKTSDKVIGHDIVHNGSVSHNSLRHALSSDLLHTSVFKTMSNGGLTPKGSRSVLAPARDKDTARGDGTTSAEDHFGIFLSEDNPEPYHQRFQYYKRVRHSRRAGEAASDLGYYGHPGSSQCRAPLMSGLDGSSSEWDAQTNRSTGDGYASDLEGHSARQRHSKRHARHSHLVPHSEAEEGYMQVTAERHDRDHAANGAPHERLLSGVAMAPPSRPAPSARSPAVSRATQPPKREGLPASRDGQSASSAGIRSQRDYASIAKELQGSQFPPPPPYKPPTRDVNPDGASNEGDLARSQGSLESSGIGAEQQASVASPLKAAMHEAALASAVGRQPALSTHWNRAPSDYSLPPPGSHGPRGSSQRAATNGSQPPYAGGTASALPMMTAADQSGWPDFVSSTPCQELLLGTNSGPPPPGDSWPSPVRAGQRTPNCALLQQPFAAGGPQPQRSLVPPTPAPCAHMPPRVSGTFYDELTTWQLSRASSGGLGAEALSRLQSFTGSSGVASRDGGGGFTHTNGWSHTPVDGAFTSAFSVPMMRPSGLEASPRSPYASGNLELCGKGAGSELGPRLSNSAYGDTQTNGARGPLSNIASAAASRHPTGSTAAADHSATKPLPEPYKSNGYGGHSPTSNVDILTFAITLAKNAELGFSIAGGIGSQGNPFRLLDKGIFVSKVSAFGPAASILQPGDKILQVNGVDFSETEHHEAVSLLKSVNQNLTITVERMQPTTV